MSLEDITDAEARIAPYIHQTPILTSKQLSQTVQHDVFLKAEHLQKTGAFKLRGATNCVHKAKGKGIKEVVTASSGNHGQAVAYITQRLGLSCTVVVPEDASALKVSAIKHYGAKVIFYGKTSADRISYAKKLVSHDKAMYVPPYNHPDIIAGQGTLGLEILNQVTEVDYVLVPIGGGGLISGIASAIKAKKPSVKVIGVEPEAAQDTYLSFLKGVRETIEAPATIADGLRTVEPGKMTFPLVKKYVDDIVLVTETEIKTAMRYAFERLKQVVEPSGAVTLAALSKGVVKGNGKQVVVVVSGGNIAFDRFAAIMKTQHV